MRSSTRTFCVEEFDSNQLQLREKEDLIAKIENLDHKENPPYQLSLRYIVRLAVSETQMKCASLEVGSY